MKSKFIIGLIASLAFASSAFAAEKEIIISGSTTVLPVMQKAGESFMAANPSISLSISGGGSGGGLKALNEGLCDVAMSSRDIKSSEVELGNKNGVEPVRTAIAIDAIVPIVNPANKVQNLTKAQLKDIYAGRITNWKEVGGDDMDIVVISRDTSSGTYESWEEMVMQKERIAPTTLMQASNGTVVQTVAKNKRAIGYIGTGYLNKSIKGLNVDGVQASAETALSNEWPIARELYIFTNGEPKDEVKRLVDYLVDPQKGQKAVAETGYVPLSN